jgi:hypothetical protein
LLGDPSKFSLREVFFPALDRPLSLKGRDPMSDVGLSELWLAPWKQKTGWSVGKPTAEPLIIRHRPRPEESLTIPRPSILQDGTLVFPGILLI